MLLFDDIRNFNNLPGPQHLFLFHGKLFADYSGVMFTFFSAFNFLWFKNSKIKYIIY